MNLKLDCMVCCVFSFSNRGRCRGRGNEDFCKGEIVMLAIESILGKEKIEEIMCAEGDGSMQAAADKRLVSITRQVRPSFVFCCFLFFVLPYETIKTNSVLLFILCTSFCPRSSDFECHLLSSRLMDLCIA